MHHLLQGLLGPAAGAWGQPGQEPRKLDYSK
jgi:hypothetical protein